MQTIPDSPQREDRLDWRTDMYLHRGHTLEAWGNFDPVLNFHRTRRDYWQALVETGFTVDARGAKHSRQGSSRASELARGAVSAATALVHLPFGEDSRMIET